MREDTPRVCAISSDGLSFFALPVAAVALSSDAVPPTFRILKAPLRAWLLPLPGVGISGFTRLTHPFDLMWYNLLVAEPLGPSGSLFRRRTVRVGVSAPVLKSSVRSVTISNNILKFSAVASIDTFAALGIIKHKGNHGFPHIVMSTISYEGNIVTARLLCTRLAP